MIGAFAVLGGAQALGGSILSYMNYRNQKTAAKYALENAKFNAAVLRSNAQNEADTLATNEGRLSEAQNSRMSDIEVAYATSGVASSSGSVAAVQDAQARADALDTWDLRRQASTKIANYVNEANWTLVSGANAYKSSIKTGATQMAMGQFSSLMQGASSFAQGAYANTQ